jgi:branched-chain amino acid aminotransferase
MTIATTPIPTCILTPHGIEPTPYVAASFAEAASHDPLGVYTIGRTYQRDHVLLWDDHLDRLANSAALEGITLNLDRTALRDTFRQLIAQGGYPESRFKITVPKEPPQHLILAVEPYKPVPAEIIANGARVVTVHRTRPNPAAKTSAWMRDRQSTVENFPAGIFEGILTNDAGELLEGTSSNFYVVVNGTLRTAVDGVLEGISRRTLLKVAGDVLPLDLHPVKLTDTLDEAFLTSAGRGIVPIVEIDGRTIGTGKPGTYTLRLREAYEAWALAHMEKI